MFATRVDSDLLYDRLDAPFYNPEFLTVQKKLNQYKLTTLESVSYTIFDPPHIAPEFTEQSPYQMIMIENLTDNGIEGDFRYITENCHLNMFRISHLEGHELLMTRVGATSGTVGVVTERHKGLNASGNLSIIKIDSEKVDRFFIFVYFNSNIGKKIIKQQIANTARDYLTIERIKSLPIPIIPKYIQTYIGNKVRKAEELQEEAKRLKEEVKDILESNLCMKKIKNILINNDEKFTWVKRGNIENRLDADYYKKTFILIEEIYLKNGIKLMRLEEILDDLYTGTTPNAEFISNEYQEIKFLRVDDLSNSLVKNEISLFIKEEIRHSLRIITPGSVLVSIAGTIGRSAVINLENCTTNQNVAVLQLKESIAKPYYLSAYFNSPVGRLFLERVSTQATVKYINNDLLKSVKIPVIDIETQSKIQELLIMASEKEILSKLLISEAKQDVEDLIEGKFDESKISEGV